VAIGFRAQRTLPRRQLLQQETPCGDVRDHAMAEVSVVAVRWGIKSIRQLATNSAGQPAT
jgi:hypothetical protein